MKVAIYVRISLDRDGTQVSVGNQQADCEAFIKERGWQVGQHYIDNDLSATSGVERPAFEQMLQDRPEAIVCWHTDRLIRLTSDLERVIALGVNIHAVKAGHLDLSTPAGRAVARTITAWATYEGEQKAERQRLAYRRAAEAGKPRWAVRPFGLNRDGTLHPTEAPLVRHWAQALLAGQSLYSLAQEANEAGVFTTRGGLWQSSTLSRTLALPTLAGIATYRGVEVGKGEWEPVLDEETWRAVKARLEANGGPHPSGGKRKYFLTGIAKCGVCLNTVMGSKNHGRGVYVCHRSKHVSRSAQHVDELVRQRALAVLQQPRIARAILGDQGEELEALRANLSVLRGRRDDAAQAYAQGLVPLAQLTSINATLGPQIAQAEAALAANAKNSPLSSLLSAEDVTTEWGVANRETQREVIRLLFDVLIDPALKGSRGGFLPEYVRTVPAGTGTPVDRAARR